MNLEMHIEAVIERVWRCTLEAVIERNWRWSIWRQSVGREARRVLRLYSLVNSQPWECDELTFELMESWLVAVDL